MAEDPYVSVANRGGNFVRQEIYIHKPVFNKSVFYYGIQLIAKE